MIKAINDNNNVKSSVDSDTDAYKLNVNQFDCNDFRNRNTRMFTLACYDDLLFDDSFSLLVKSYVCFYLFALDNPRTLIRLRNDPSYAPWNSTSTRFDDSTWVPYKWFYTLYRNSTLMKANRTCQYVNIDNVWKAHLDMWARQFFRSDHFYVDFDTHSGLGLYSKVNGLTLPKAGLSGFLESIDAGQYQKLQHYGFNSFFRSPKASNKSDGNDEWWMLFGTVSIVNDSAFSHYSLTHTKEGKNSNSLVQYVEYMLQTQSRRLNSPPPNISLAREVSSVVYPFMIHLRGLPISSEYKLIVSIETFLSNKDESRRSKDDGDISYILINKPNPDQAAEAITHREVYHGIKVVRSDEDLNIPPPVIEMNQQLFINYKKVVHGNTTEDYNNGKRKHSSVDRLNLK